MRNFVFGYARVSTEQQNLDRQIDMLEKYGVDHIYNEKIYNTKQYSLKEIEEMTGVKRSTLYRRIKP